jgi:hypothetical protein
MIANQLLEIKLDAVLVIKKDIVWDFANLLVAEYVIIKVT